jgi:hypothetical protein
LDAIVAVVVGMDAANHDPDLAVLPLRALGFEFWWQRFDDPFTFD